MTEQSEEHMRIVPTAMAMAISIPVTVPPVPVVEKRQEPFSAVTKKEASTTLSRKQKQALMRQAVTPSTITTSKIFQQQPGNENQPQQQLTVKTTENISPSASVSSQKRIYLGDGKVATMPRKSAQTTSSFETKIITPKGFLDENQENLEIIDSISAPISMNSNYPKIVLMSMPSEQPLISSTPPVTLNSTPPVTLNSTPPVTLNSKGYHSSSNAVDKPKDNYLSNIIYADPEDESKTKSKSKRSSQFSFDSKLNSASLFTQETTEIYHDDPSVTVGPMETQRSKINSLRKSNVPILNQEDFVNGIKGILDTPITPTLVPLPTLTSRIPSETTHIPIETTHIPIDDDKNAPKEADIKKLIAAYGSIKISNNQQPLNPHYISNKTRQENHNCSECEIAVTIDTGFEIPALNAWFHPKCFRCVKCKMQFDDFNPFVPWNNLAWCEKHYQLIDATRPLSPNHCGACLEPVGKNQKKSVAFRQTFHANHLKCDICHERIRGVHAEVHDKIYCKKDYDLLESPPCPRCNLPTKENIVGTSVATYHKACFTCAGCKKPFVDNQYYLYRGETYCLQDYYHAANALCAGCFQPIMGTFVNIQPDNPVEPGDAEKLPRYHPGCWKCQDKECGRDLGNACFMVQKRQYCLVHAEETLRGLVRRGISGSFEKFLVHNPEF